MMYRCDQYQWISKGVYTCTMKCDNLVLKKRSNVIDDPSCDTKGSGNTEFRRWEYWGFECYFVLHYTSDHTAFVPFQHRNAKFHLSDLFHL